MDIDLRGGSLEACFLCACIIEHFGTIANFMAWYRWWELGRNDLDLLLRSIAEGVEA